MHSFDPFICDAILPKPSDPLPPPHIKCCSSSTGEISALTYMYNLYLPNFKLKVQLCSP